MAKPDDKTLPIGTISVTATDDERTRAAGAPAAPALTARSEKTQAVLPRGLVQAAPSNRSTNSVEVYREPDGIHLVYPTDPMQTPVCAILLVIAGPGKGMALPITYGRNSLGTSEQARVRLDLGDAQMSSVHCIVSYDHEDRTFDVREADGATNFTRVNGGRIGSSQALKTGDVLKLGSTELRFVEICGPNWDWGDGGATES